MKLVAALALATAAFVLSAASSTAGTSREAAARPLVFSPRAPMVTPFAPARRSHRAVGLNCVVACSLYESTINQYFTDIAADSANSVTTNVYSVLPQYSSLSSSILYSTSFAGSYVDESPFPTAKCNDAVQGSRDRYCVTNKQLQSEIGKVIAANAWPTQSTTTLYFIFTPANVGVCFHAGTAKYNPCTTNAFCAFHSSTNSFIYAVEPDAHAVSGGYCDTGEAPAGNGADSTLSTISHEQIEAITDPYNSTWWSEDPEPPPGDPGGPSGQYGPFYGSEIGDLCAWNFGTPLGGTPGVPGAEGTAYNQVINGHKYWLQQEWSNADAGCVQYAGGTVTNFTPSDQLYGGVGPLVDHNGPRMTSTAVYAIYWVPAAPVNDTNLPPRIVGDAQVGKRLKALHGLWTYSMAYEYRWLRCSAAGTSCGAIKKATDFHYLLTPADSGHRIEVHVTATNQAGSVSATSVPTAKVRS